MPGIVVLAFFGIWGQLKTLKFKYLVIGSVNVFFQPTTTNERSRDGSFGSTASEL
jgi:hypothetical protein